MISTLSMHSELLLNISYDMRMFLVTRDWERRKGEGVLAGGGRGATSIRFDSHTPEAPTLLNTLLASIVV